MSTSIKPTGIIYRAFNKISGKSYIGQTTKTLSYRKQQHIRETIKKDYKFGRALRKYKLEDWTWTILAEVPLEDLDEYERFFIDDLNTYKSGYNSLNGKSWEKGGHPDNCDPTIYELWHPEYGEIRGTKLQLSKTVNHLSELIRGKRNQANGFVLLVNKDKYDEILNLHSFYHPNHGVIKCTCQELYDSFPQYFSSKECGVYPLANKHTKLLCGWCLEENKDSYLDLINKSNRGKCVTLSHKEHGTHVLLQSEFVIRFNLTSGGVSALVTGIQKTHRGWKLAEEKENGFDSKD